MENTKFKVGDRVRCKNCDYSWGEAEGVIVGVCDSYFKVKIHKAENDDWKHCNDGIWGYRGSELEVLTDKKTNIMTKLNSMMKRLLDASTKKLIKADYINGDLQLTEKGKEALNTIVFEQNKEELVKMAEEDLKEAKENK